MAGLEALFQRRSSGKSGAEGGSGKATADQQVESIVTPPLAVSAAIATVENPTQHGHGPLTKPVRDRKLREMIVRRYKCVSCAKTSSAGYRMRIPTLELWNKWPKIRLHLRRPELGLGDTNNVSGRAIGRSKVRYRTNSR